MRPLCCYVAEGGIGPWSNACWPTAQAAPKVRRLAIALVAIAASSFSACRTPPDQLAAMTDASESQIEMAEPQSDMTFTVCGPPYGTGPCALAANTNFWSGCSGPCTLTVGVWNNGPHDITIDRVWIAQPAQSLSYRPQDGVPFSIPSGSLSGGWLTWDANPAGLIGAALCFTTRETDCGTVGFAIVSRPF